MTQEDDALWLFSLSAYRRILFVSELSHNLTIAMRVVSHNEEENTLNRIRNLNEIHHMVSGYLLKANLKKEDVRWIRPIIQSVSTIEDIMLKQQVELCWIQAKEATELIKED